MNKQINSINGYSCVQVQVQVQLNFQNVINAHVTCLHTHFNPPHHKILYETLGGGVVCCCFCLFVIVVRAHEIFE